MRLRPTNGQWFQSKQEHPLRRSMNLFRDSRRRSRRLMSSLSNTRRLRRRLRRTEWESFWLSSCSLVLAALLEFANGKDIAALLKKKNLQKVESQSDPTGKSSRRRLRARIHIRDMPRSLSCLPSRSPKKKLETNHEL